MKKIIYFLVVCIVGCAITPCAYAGKNPIDITREVKMPATIKPNQDAVGRYLLKNNLPFTVFISIVIPSKFVHQKIGMGACSFPAPLNPNETCQMVIIFNAPNVGDSFSDATIVFKFGTNMVSLQPPGIITTVVN